MPAHALHAPSRAITVPVKSTAARRARWSALHEVLKRSRRTEASGFDAYWEAVGEILDRQLYVDGGYDGVAAFVKAEVKEPYRTVLRNVRVAKYASPADEARYGTAILDAALGYVEAKIGHPIDGKLPVRFDTLRVPVVGRGAAKHVLLKSATHAQIVAATRALTKHARVPHASPSHAAILEALSKKKSLGGVSVRVTSGMLHLGAIPLWAVKDLVEALRGVRLPADPGEADAIHAHRSQSPRRRSRIGTRRRS